MNHKHQTRRTNPRETLKCCLCYSHPDCEHKREKTVLEGLSEYRANRTKTKIAMVKWGAVVVILGCLIVLWAR